LCLIEIFYPQLAPFKALNFRNYIEFGAAKRLHLGLNLNAKKYNRAMVLTQNLIYEILPLWRRSPWAGGRQANHQSNYVDSKMLENASFMRLKNFTLGYDIPRKSLGRQNIVRTAKVFFTGRNLLTFTKFRGIDPEVNRNVSYGVNPNTKQLSVGVEIGL